MFEDSLDGFISRWRKHAAPVRIFSRTEGLPLLECETAGAILQVLERTGPYLAPPGPARAIINVTVGSVEVVTPEDRSLESTGVGQARGCGVIVLRDEPFLVVDVGAPLVVGVEEQLPAEAVVGAWVSFTAVPPIHGFVLNEPRLPSLQSENGEAP